MSKRQTTPTGRVDGEDVPTQVPPPETPPVDPVLPSATPLLPPDHHGGKSGRYVLDPNTGERRRVE